MASQQTQEEMNMYDNCGLGYSDSDGEDENPEPKWNLPNWKGNASVCGGCIKRITRTGDTRGCEECDETWDMPDLIPPPRAYFDYEPIDTFIINKDSIDTPGQINNEIIANDDADASQSVSAVGAVYCEGCELFDAGLGGENQMGHACMGY